MKISEATTVSTDIKSITAIIFGVAVGVWSYFGLQEKINKHDTRLELMEKDLEENRPVDESVITLMKMSVTGLIGVIGCYIGGSK